MAKIKETQDNLKKQISYIIEEGNLKEILKLPSDFDFEIQAERTKDNELEYIFVSGDKKIPLDVTEYSICDESVFLEDFVMDFKADNQIVIISEDIFVISGITQGRSITGFKIGSDCRDFLSIQRNSNFFAFSNEATFYNFRDFDSLDIPNSNPIKPLAVVNGKYYASKAFDEALTEDSYNNFVESLKEHTDYSFSHYDEHLESAWNDLWDGNNPIETFNNILEVAKERGDLSQDEINNLNIVSRKGKEFYVLPKVEKDLNYYIPCREDITIFTKPSQKVIEVTTKALEDTRDIVFANLNTDIIRSILEQIEMANVVKDFKAWDLNDDEINNFAKAINKGEGLKFLGIDSKNLINEEPKEAVKTKNHR